MKYLKYLSTALSITTFCAISFAYGPFSVNTQQLSNQNQNQFNNYSNNLNQDQGQLSQSILLNTQKAVTQAASAFQTTYIQNLNIHNPSTPSTQTIHPQSHPQNQGV